MRDQFNKSYNKMKKGAKSGSGAYEFHPTFKYHNALQFLIPHITPNE